jgi:hypothetical protein
MGSGSSNDISADHSSIHRHLQVTAVIESLPLRQILSILEAQNLFEEFKTCSYEVIDFRGWSFFRL